MAESFKKKPLKSQRVRLTLSRNGGIEITHTELPDNALPVTDPEVAMNNKNFMDLPEVVFSENKSDSNWRHLYHKTTLRKLYDAERNRAVAKGYYEVLFINEKSEVTEGSYTNIFLQKGRKLLTPPILSGLLPGVFRKHLLQKYPDVVEEALFRREDIELAEAVYVGNSVRGLVRVKVRSENLELF